MNDEETEEWSPEVPPFSEETIIEDIALSYSEKVVRRVFDELDLHCFACTVGRHDDLRDVARLHRKEKDELIQHLSDLLSDEEPLDEPSYYDDGSSS